VYWRNGRKFYLMSSSRSAEVVFWAHGEPLVLDNNSADDKIGGGILEMLSRCRPGIHRPHYFKERVAYDEEAQNRNSNRKLTTCDNRILTTPERFIIVDDEGDHPALSTIPNFKFV
ncbi:MAG TPA: hypothetical protein VEI46_08395, partial [Thermodesulfovibrionales bacterium]|nr:hypothetical protein [Thermodesulfovibrionales bacterium]